MKTPFKFFALSSLIFAGTLCGNAETEVIGNLSFGVLEEPKFSKEQQALIEAKVKTRLAEGWQQDETSKIVYSQILNADTTKDLKKANYYIKALVPQYDYEYGIGIEMEYFKNPTPAENKINLRLLSMHAKGMFPAGTTDIDTCVRSACEHLLDKSFPETDDFHLSDGPTLRWILIQNILLNKDFVAYKIYDTGDSVYGTCGNPSKTYYRIFNRKTGTSLNYKYFFKPDKLKDLEKIVNQYIVLGKLNYREISFDDSNFQYNLQVGCNDYGFIFYLNAYTEFTSGNDLKVTLPYSALEDFIAVHPKYLWRNEK